MNDAFLSSPRLLQLETRVLHLEHRISKIISSSSSSDGFAAVVIAATAGC